jgi:general secretion pathway protein L
MFTAPEPAGNKRRWQRALPYLAEQYTLTDPEDVHVVPSTSSEPGMISVSVVAKSWLKQLVTASAAAGLPLRRVITETLMPDLPADSWLLVWDGRSGFLRTSQNTGLALDCGNSQTPPLALTLSLAKISTPKQIQLRMTATSSPTETPKWDLPVPLVPGAVWDWRCAAISDTSPNLLWGDFSPPIRLFDGLARLKPALYILLAALFIEVTGSHIEWAKLAHEKNLLTQQTSHIFHGTFGDDSELVNAPLQMQRNLTALRHTAGLADKSDFLSLLDATSQALGPLKSGAIRSLNYEAGKLEFDIKLANAAEFKSIEHNLKRNGLQVRISDMHDQGDGTEAKIALSLEGLR